MNVMQIMDRKVITFLTTEHLLAHVYTGKTNYLTNQEVTKPAVMHEYNKYMGGVDQNDQLTKYSAFTYRSTKWWKNVFYLFIEFMYGERWLKNNFLLSCMLRH